MIKKEKHLKVERDILIFAFRYSLGRMSYAPYKVVDTIKSNIKNISTDDIKLYIKEIKECQNFGMDFDKSIWLDFLEYLEEELKKR